MGTNGNEWETITGVRIPEPALSLHKASVPEGLSGWELPAPWINLNLWDAAPDDAGSVADAEGEKC